MLLGTSNSKDGLINQAKTQLWEIVNELSFAKCVTGQPDLCIALYEYGNDGLENALIFSIKIQALKSQIQSFP